MTLTLGSFFCVKSNWGSRHGTGRIARFVARNGSAAAVPIRLWFDCDARSPSRNKGLKDIGRALFNWDRFTVTAPLRPDFAVHP